MEISLYEILCGVFGFAARELYEWIGEVTGWSNKKDCLKQRRGI